MSAPTADQLEVAFSRIRGDDWPSTLHELAQAAARMKLVECAAKALARGERVPARQAANDTPPAPVRALAHPARLYGAGPIPHRSRSDGPDLKRLAAGDRDD